MSRDWVSDVREFAEAMSPDQIGTVPAFPSMETIRLRLALMQEEMDETREAINFGELPEVADGLVDLIYVAIGAAIAFGIDLRPCWDAVHAANLAKLGGGRDERGKVVKPAGWQPPDIAGVLKDQGWTPDAEQVA